MADEGSSTVASPMCSHELGAADRPSRAPGFDRTGRQRASRAAVCDGTDRLENELITNKI